MGVRTSGEAAAALIKKHGRCYSKAAVTPNVKYCIAVEGGKSFVRLSLLLGCIFNIYFVLIVQVPFMIA